MPYIPFKYLKGRALPALFLPLLLIPVFYSCTQDKNPKTTVSVVEKSAEPESTLQKDENIVQAGQSAADEEKTEPAVIAADSSIQGRAPEPVPAREPSVATAPVEQEDLFEAGMGRREGGHFLVKFEGGENATAGHLIGLLLEEAYLKVGRDLGHYPDRRIEALLYSREAFRDITKSPSWAGAIYDGRIKLPAGGITEKTALLESVIFHEYTHAVVRELSRDRAPVWLNEGVAQYEEGQSTAQYTRALSGLAARGVLRLRPFEGSFMGLRAQEAQAAYVLSLSATEYIVREFGLFSVRSILERLGEGMSVEDAISASLGISYEELEKRWAASLLN